jgi:chromosome segregation ATPase
MNDAFLAWWETADDFGGSVEAACRAAFKVGAAWRQLRIPVLEAERDSWQKQASRWLDDSLRFAGERDTMRIAVDRLTGELAALSQADGKVERGIERLRARVRELELCITGLEKEGERVARELDAECDALRTAAGCSEALRERLSLAETALERERHARKLAQTEREKASEERNRAGVDARCEVGELIAQLKADRADAINQHAAALDLVSRIRWALGDNGARMQDELIEWCKHLSTGAATERELVINRKESEL